MIVANVAPEAYHHIAEDLALMDLLRAVEPHAETVRGHCGRCHTVHTLYWHEVDMTWCLPTPTN